MLKFVKLSDVAGLTVGFVGTMAEHYTDSGVRFLRSLNIAPFDILETDIKYISEEFNSQLKKSELHTNDVVIVRTGIPGTCCVIPEEYDGCNCSDVVIVHPNMDLVDPHYLCAYINVWGQKQISNNKVGAIQQHFNVHTAEEMLIPLPDIEQQKKAAGIIKVLNAKIKGNSNICRELESMAKTFYDYWFTQFDFPNAGGKPYRSSGGKMVWNEQLKRNIPEGWEVKTVGSVLDGIPKTTRVQVSDYLRDGNFPVIDQSTNFIAGFTNDKTALLQSTDGFIVFGDHTRIVKYIRFPFARGADGTQVLKSNTTRMPNELLYQAISKIDLSNHGYARHFKFLKDSLLILPDKITAQRFKELVVPMYEQQVKCYFENIVLAQLRDWLLPMLMNGQATIE